MPPLRQWRIVCLAAVVLFVCAGAASAASVSHTFTFDRTELSLEKDGEFDVVRLAGAMETSETGLPELPLILATFALPPGTDASGVRVVRSISSEREGLHLVAPAQPEVPLSMPELAERVPPDEGVYESDRVYPEVVCELLATGNLGGQRVASVAVYPVSYVPSERTLTLREEIEIEVDLKPAERELRSPRALSPRASAARAERAAAVVVNASDIEPADAVGDRTETVDYLLVTSASYESLFQPLADWKSAKGVPAEIVTTAWIYSNYSGVDNAEKIRNCIIDYYENHGTTWVLLGGDTDVVPARVAFAKSGDAGNTIRCDLYFSDLDGTWDEDGDGTWGEMTADNIDMYADVFVGRAPVNTTAEVTRFVQRTLTYEGAPAGDPLPTDYQLDMLFLAEVLWTDPWTDHAECKNMIDDDSVPERFDPITKLYQTNGQLSKSNTISELNSGHNIINHNGHAYWNTMSIGSSSLYRSDFDGLTNGSRYGIMYSIGCWPAAIDYDCMAEHWVNAPNGGGVAFIGNTRYGWGSPGAPGNGTSDEFDREFFEQLFDGGIEQIGATHAAHKDAFVGMAHSSSYYRYCLYELTLLGDPEMRIWTESPDLPATIDHAATTPLGESPFVVTVSRDGEPLDDALAVLSGDGVYVSDTTVGGKAILHPDTSSEGTLILTVSGPGMSAYQSTVEAVDMTPDTDAPAAVASLVVADPFDTGGAVDLDWTAYSPEGDVAFYNVYRSESPFSDVTGMTPLDSGLIDPSVRSFTDGTADDGTPFYYAVTAVDWYSNEGGSVDSRGPIAASNNARILLFDADDGDLPFDGVNDDYSTTDGTEVAWIEALDASGELYCVSEELPSDLSPYDLIIYLGGVINFRDGASNVRMTDDEALALTGFIDGGGSIYVEEPAFGGTYDTGGTTATQELWSRFHALYESGSMKATGNVETLTGQGGELMNGMSFEYDYQSWPDQFVEKVSPDGSTGTSLLWHDQSAEGRGSLYVDPSTGSNRYVVPVLLGGMSDGTYPSTRIEHVTRVLSNTGILGASGIDGVVSGPVGRLEQNAPNPFNPETSIRFHVASERARVRLDVYDVAGRLVTTLLDGVPGAGEHVVRWDGREAGGRSVASGIYFARLAVDDWSASRKMVLLK